MTPTRAFAAWLFLVALAVGELGLPVWHAWEHGAQHQATLAAAATVQHIHADGRGVTEAFPPGQEAHQDCVFCVPRPSSLTDLSPWPRPQTRDQAYADASGQGYLHLSFFHLPIRGPPLG